MKIGNIDLEWKGHSSFSIKEENGKVIYIDPYQLSGNLQKADVILITHSHYDHCSLEDIQKIVKDGTTIVVSADAQSKITRLDNEINMQIMEPGDEIEIKGIKVKAVPAYNINKQFHEKDENWLGYVIDIDNTIIYHAGDTDLIPEMEKLTGYSKQGHEFIALLPVGGKYTMDREEAAKAASIIKATITIPIHYGEVAGGKNDAEKFCEIAGENGIKCKVLDKT